MHWTILSDYDIFGTEEQSNAPDHRYEEIVVGEARFIVENRADGQRLIHRLISPRPRDYLRPEWQPGMPYLD